MPPNSRSCLFGNGLSATAGHAAPANVPGYQDGDRGITPSSEHTGGVNVLMGDGAVRFIGNSIDLRTWWALGGRNDGMIIDAF